MTGDATPDAVMPATPREDPHGTPEAVVRLRRARLADRVAGRAIRIGGVVVLLAVVTIFVFVGMEAAPLLRGADVGAAATFRVPGVPTAVAADEYRAFVACTTREGDLAVLDAATGEVRSRERVVEDGRKAAAAYVGGADGPVFVVAGDDGRVRVATVRARVVFAQGRRSVTPEVELGEPLDAREDGALDRVAGALLEGEKVFAAVAGPGHLGLVRFKVDSDRVRADALDTSRLATGGSAPEVTSLAVALVSETARVYAGFRDGRVARWDVEWSEDPVFHESIDVSREPVTAIAALLGGETLVCAAADGSVTTWFGVRASPEAAHWDLTRIRSFPPLRDPALVAPTARGKGFVVLGAGGEGRTHHATTGATRAELPRLDAAPAAASFAPKNDALVVADAQGGVRLVPYADPHPEAAPGALFGRVWYEGGTEPEHRWQSTGGGDDFEPKLSLVPLIFGTLKGVVFALLFSVPIALLAAIYTALFLPARVKAVVKPTLEIMAALPSVVVGLLAALWLSPLVERHLPSAFATLPSFAVAFLLLVVAWALLPRPLRLRLTESAGTLALCGAAVLLAIGIAAAAGPWMERALFGGDVKAWLRDTLGLTYDPRNATVVGLAMGFAVIPVIFTIAEDAITNVPRSLWAASEALGASRWQTTIRVVLPAATPGIFAALMLGFGRAVGETMIVLMATGNTPILDFSPFNGMRTISACIAVEIPEAPHGGTLYRVLFLAGALLFLFTFVCNTAAEVVGTRLRRRYGRAG